MVDSINRRERKKLHSKQTIIEAAVKLFVQKGFNETTIAEIMDEADLGIGTFYNYFQSKEEILKQFLAEIMSKTNKTHVNLLNEHKTVSERLTETLLFTGKILDKNRFVLHLFLSIPNKSASADAKGLTPPPHSPTFKAIFDSIIKEGQEKGEFRKDIPAEVIIEMFHAIFYAASFSRLEIAFMENIEYKLKLILDGLIIKKHKEEYVSDAIN